MTQCEFKKGELVEIKNCCGNPNATILDLTFDGMAMIMLENRDISQGHTGAKLIDTKFLIKKEKPNE